MVEWIIHDFCLACMSTLYLLHFFQVKYTERKLKTAVSFLPVARSSATLEFYKTVIEDRIEDKRTHVVAMDLGKT